MSFALHFHGKHHEPWHFQWLGNLLLVLLGILLSLALLPDHGYWGWH